MLVLYCLLQYTGSYLTDKKMLGNIGLVTIAITILNFLFNGIPLLVDVVMFLVRKIRLCIMKMRKARAKRIREKHEREKLRART